MIGGRRLDRKHIEPSPGDLPRLHRVQQRVLIDQAAACGIDHKSGRLHECQRLRVDKLAVGIGQRHMQRKIIRLAQQCLAIDRARASGGDRLIV